LSLTRFFRFSGAGCKSSGQVSSLLQTCNHPKPPQEVIPELDGRFTGYSLRVPVPVVSIVDLTVTLRREVTVAEINAAFRKAAESGPLQDILGYSDEPLVSCDYQGDPRSSIIDGLSTLVIGGKLVKVLAWYDNEWGFSNRLVDLTLLMNKRGL
jgi:glyceraldehyde 3-phosphate dehydrogenase